MDEAFCCGKVGEPSVDGAMPAGQTATRVVCLATWARLTSGRLRNAAYSHVCLIAKAPVPVGGRDASAGPYLNVSAGSAKNVTSWPGFFCAPLPRHASVGNS